nr:MAG TPA: hypothetical protein [Caudoviricetes sp.]
MKGLNLQNKQTINLQLFTPQFTPLYGRYISTKRQE